MSERIIWTDRSGALVDGGEPNTVRYIRCDLYEILVEALLEIGQGSIHDPQARAWSALQRVNGG